MITPANVVDLFHFFTPLHESCPFLRSYTLYVMQKEHTILSMTGQLLHLHPDIRQLVQPKKPQPNLPASPLLGLPDYIWSHIFSYVDVRSLGSLNRVCYKWMHLSDSSWKAKVLKNWKVTEDYSAIESWKHYYLYRSITGM